MKYILQKDGEGCGKSSRWLIDDDCITFKVIFCCSATTFISGALSADAKLKNLRQILDFQEDYFQNTQDENNSATVEISNQSEQDLVLKCLGTV